MTEILTYRIFEKDCSLDTSLLIYTFESSKILEPDVLMDLFFEKITRIQFVRIDKTVIRFDLDNFVQNLGGMIFFSHHDKKQRSGLSIALYVSFRDDTRLKITS